MSASFVPGRKMYAYTLVSMNTFRIHVGRIRNASAADKLRECGWFWVQLNSKITPKHCRRSPTDLAVHTGQ